MFKQQFPKPISQIPSVGGLKPNNILEMNEKKNVFKQANPQLTPQQLTPQQIDEKPKDEDLFKDMVKERLAKIDEFLVIIKEKQDQLNQTSASVPTQQPANTVIPQLQKKESKPRSKRTYYKINDTMWNDIKSSFVDLADHYKNNAYSDGTSYYIEHRGKKVLLDGKGYLKILNDK